MTLMECPEQKATLALLRQKAKETGNTLLLDLYLKQMEQIGNAVPRRLARAIVAAAIRQDPDVRFLETTDAAKAA